MRNEFTTRFVELTESRGEKISRGHDVSSSALEYTDRQKGHLQSDRVSDKFHRCLVEFQHGEVFQMEGE